MACFPEDMQCYFGPLPKPGPAPPRFYGAYARPGRHEGNNVYLENVLIALVQGLGTRLAMPSETAPPAEEGAHPLSFSLPPGFSRAEYVCGIHLCRDEVAARAGADGTSVAGAPCELTVGEDGAYHIQFKVTYVADG